jgi:spore maturation protein SpmB
MIYAKVKLNIEFEMNIPMSKAVSIDDVNAEIEKDGGKEPFIAKMAETVIESMSSPFSTGKVTSGTVDVVEV